MDDDLRERVAKVLADYEGPEHAPLRALVAELVADRDRQLARRDTLIDSLTARLGQLEAQVAGLERATKRQAAPFSKGLPKAKPSKPGRKPGPDYGAKGHRIVPARRPDRELDAPLPERCPHCGGRSPATGRRPRRSRTSRSPA